MGIPVFSWEAATWAPKLNGCWAAAAVQRWAGSNPIPLALSEARNADENCSVSSMKDRLQKAVRQTPGERTCLWLASGLMLEDSEGYKWVLTGTDIYSGLGFAYPVVDTNAPNMIKGLEQKIVQQFGPLSYISSDQGTHFHPQSNDLIENLDEQLKHWLSP